MTIQDYGSRARGAARALRQCGDAALSAAPAAALTAMATAIEAHIKEILDANAADIAAAGLTGAAGNGAMADRLLLTDARVLDMAAAVRGVAALPSPLGQTLRDFTRPDGLRITQVRVPIGVIGIIYEARPNVTADAAALCLKTGNAVILRGGKEAIRSNTAIAAALREGVQTAGLPADAVQLIEDTSRDSSVAMMTATGLIDLLIPRGGAGLIRTVVENARVPVIETGTGNCHIYVDKAADIDMAARIAVNAKCSRPSVCNAAETLLVHAAIAGTALPVLAAALRDHGVTLYSDARARALIGGEAAGETDFANEYLDLKMAVAVVDSLGDALAHIARYGSGHSECIVTGDPARAERFFAGVDAAAVYVNASTRFTDGGEFGLGAEIGISTQKLHARGPMGLEAMTTTAWRVYGQGQTRG
ncbi:MAG: glutamate-5-semialdehyde dehydrogenase [Oscillospiraceae bacterium]|nr:glutamate-5-semialdehyde dehydrogenase [Oscillospiraceae bacterium]